MFRPWSNQNALSTAHHNENLLSMERSMNQQILIINIYTMCLYGKIVYHYHHLM